jgi:hypothetical protein
MEYFAVVEKCLSDGSTPRAEEACSASAGYPVRSIATLVPGEAASAI